MQFLVFSAFILTPFGFCITMVFLFYTIDIIISVSKGKALKPPKVNIYVYFVSAYQFIFF